MGFHTYGRQVARRHSLSEHGVNIKDALTLDDRTSVTDLESLATRLKGADAARVTVRDHANEAAACR